jgi:hypothetical protein
MTRYLLTLRSRNEFGGVQVVLVFDDEMDAHDEIARRMQNPDIVEALYLLHADYQIIRVLVGVPPRQSDPWRITVTKRTASTSTPMTTNAARAKRARIATGADE